MTELLTALQETGVVTGPGIVIMGIIIYYNRLLLSREVKAHKETKVERDKLQKRLIDHLEEGSHGGS